MEGKPGGLLWTGCVMPMRYPSGPVAYSGWLLCSGVREMSELRTDVVNISSWMADCLQSQSQDIIGKGGNEDGEEKGSQDLALGYSSMKSWRT